MEDKDLEYKLKQDVSNFVQEKINASLLKYYSKYKNNIGYLLYYPLIILEKNFATGVPELVQTQRPAITWFIKELMKFGYSGNMNFRYDEKEKKVFEKKYYEMILNLYNDYISSEEVKAMNPLVSYLFREINENTIEIIKPVLDNKYREKSMYYFISHDEMQKKKEEAASLKVTEYLFQNYLPIPPTAAGFQKIKALSDNTEATLLQFCKERVNTDIEKLGERVRSEFIRNIDDITSILGSFYYLSSVKHFAQALNLEKNYFDIDYEVLVGKITTMSGVQVERVRSFLSYLCLAQNLEGTLTHFPIISYNNKAIFIPSSFMLNDWHFNLVNGHYHKKVTFIKRDKTISKTIVDGIVDKAKSFSNIITSSEKQYRFVDQTGEPKQSDIDVMLFDKLNNTFLVVECKWIDNHFTSEKENNQKIVNTINEIYKDQLSKHEEYLNLGLESLKNIFDNHPDIVALTRQPKYYYVAIDKRNQIHFNEKHMITYYMMLYMMDYFSTDGILNLEALISEMDSLSTSTTYFEIDHDNTTCFEVNGYNFITEDFNISY